MFTIRTFYLIIILYYKNNDNILNVSILSEILFYFLFQLNTTHLDIPYKRHRYLFEYTLFLLMLEMCTLL